VCWAGQLLSKHELEALWLPSVLLLLATKYLKADGVNR